MPPVGAMIANRRRYLRMPASVEVIVHTPGGSLKGLSVDISEQGMLLKIGDPPAVGSLLRISFRLLPRELPIDVTAMVKRIDDHGRAGLLFSHITPPDQRRIKNFI